MMCGVASSWRRWPGTQNGSHSRLAGIRSPTSEALRGDDADFAVLVHTLGPLLRRVMLPGLLPLPLLPWSPCLPCWWCRLRRESRRTPSPQPLLDAIEQAGSDHRLLVRLPTLDVQTPIALSTTRPSGTCVTRRSRLRLAPAQPTPGSGPISSAREPHPRALLERGEGLEGALVSAPLSAHPCLRTLVYTSVSTLLRRRSQR